MPVATTEKVAAAPAFTVRLTGCVVMAGDPLADEEPAELVLPLLPGLAATFAQDSFVPHEPLSAESDWEEAPVLLTCPGARSTELLERAPPDVVVNVAGSIPPARKAARQVLWSGITRIVT